YGCRRRANRPRGGSLWSWAGGANLCKRAFGGSRTRACRPQTESPARQSEESSYEEAPLPGAAAGPGAVGSRETASQLDDGPFRWPLERSMASVRGKWGGGPPGKSTAPTLATAGHA